MKEWNSIFTGCSLKLMKLLVRQEEMDLAALKIQIQRTRESFTTMKTSSDFQALDKKMKT